MSIREEKQAVVVMGAGMAGLVAAIEGASSGAQVIVLDKLSRAVIWENIKSTSPSGSGNETGRSMGGGLARFSNREPIDEALSRHAERGWGRVDLNLIRAYLERVAEDCRWLRDDLGLPYEGLRVKGMGPGLGSFLYETVQKRGINVLFETKVIKLLADNRGAITGVRAKTANEVVDFKTKAVVLASGGFEGNQEMMIKYVGPDITYGTVLAGCPTNTGDGHLMALEMGAQLINLSVCHVRTTDRFCEVGPARHLQHIYPMGILVNKNCQRFVDEGTADSDTIANAIVYQPGHKAALIFDEKARKLYPEEYETYPRKEVIIKVARTIGELAEKIEMSPNGLRNLIEEFNGAVSDSKAVRLTIPKANGAFKIDTPPFYGFYPVLPGLNHSLGGLRVNTEAQVLDRENDPIPGLYAAGSIVNWSFGMPYSMAGVRTYMGSYHAGNSGGLPIALVLGRIAGRSAAAEAIRP